MPKPVFRAGDGLDLDYDGVSMQFGNNQREWFIARITQVGPLVSINEGRSGGSWSGSGSGSVSPNLTATAYGWKEQIPGISGVGYMDKPGGREGDVSANPFKNPAFEINDNSLVVGDYVLMRIKCYAGLVDKQYVFECIKSGGNSSAELEIEVVTNVDFTNCILTTTKETIRIPGAYIVA